MQMINVADEVTSLLASDPNAVLKVSIEINAEFPGSVVRKDLVKAVKGNAIVPTYVLEYLLGQYCATDDEASIQTGIETVKEILRKHYVHRSEAGLIQSTIKEKGRYKVIDQINATGYGLTFGLHSHIDDRVQRIVEGIRVGNTYVNRNQIGAVVGSQPFGGEGLSGTGPKEGGPHYLTRFTRPATPEAAPDQATVTATEVSRALSAPWPATLPQAEDMPGPTGESNRLSLTPRLPILCLGPGRAAALQQAETVRKLGGHAVEAPGLPAEALTTLQGFSGAIWWGEAEAGRAHAQALAQRKGPILPLIAMPDAGHAHLERHLCTDTTASGGNAQLLAAVADA